MCRRSYRPITAASLGTRQRQNACTRWICFVRKTALPTKPYATRIPWHNGKVERSHRSDQERFYTHRSFYSFDDLSDAEIPTPKQQHPYVCSPLVIPQSAPERAYARQIIPLSLLSAMAPPVSAKNQRFFGRGACRETIFALENEIFRRKNRPVPTVHAAGRD